MVLTIQRVGEAPVQIETDHASAITLKIQEFDKLIADAEANVANLKVKRAAFIYDSNVQGLESKFKAHQSQSPMYGPIL